MPRLMGVDIPNDKATEISLTYLFGVGSKTARELCHKCGIDGSKKARELSDEELSLIGSVLERDYTVEGPLRRQLTQSINRQIGLLRNEQDLALGLLDLPFTP